MEKPYQKIAIGVTTSVLAGLILRYAADITPLDAIHWFWEFTKACWVVIIGKTATPRWLLGILILFSTILVALVIGKLKKSAQEPTYLDYLEDSFDGLVWRWQFGSRGTILNTWCYCPSCDTVLVYREDFETSYGFGGGMKNITHFTCERCNSKKATLEGHRNSIIPRIERQIDRKIRVGEWREVIGRKYKAA